MGTLVTRIGSTICLLLLLSLPLAVMPALAGSITVRRDPTIEVPGSQTTGLPSTPTSASEPTETPATDSTDPGSSSASGTDPSATEAGEPRTIEFTPPRTSLDSSAPAGETSAPSEAATLRWHIRNNVCNGSLSADELRSLFPSVTPAQVTEVCGG